MKRRVYFTLATFALLFVTLTSGHAGAVSSQPTTAASLPRPNLLATPTIKAPRNSQGTSSVYLPLVMNSQPPLPPIIPPTTKVLTTSTTSNISAISADSSVFTFTQTTAQLNALAPGDVIVGDASAAAPYGFLRKVNSVSSVGGQVVVQTAPAALEDAIQQGEVHMSRTLTPSDLSSDSYSKGVSLARSPRAAQQGDFILPINNVVLYDADGNPATTDDQIVANGSIDLSPTFYLDYVIQNFRLQSLNFTTTANESANLKITSTVADLNVQKEVQVAQFKPQWYQCPTAWIGVPPTAVPIVVCPILTVVVGIDGSVQVGISTGVTQTAALTGGIQYANGSWSPVKQFSNQFQFDPPSLLGTLSFQGYATSTLTFLVDGVVAPNVALKFYLELDANPANTPWWKLYGGLEVPVGISIDVFSHVIAGYSAVVIDYRCEPTAHRSVLTDRSS